MLSASHIFHHSWFSSNLESYYAYPTCCSRPPEPLTSHGPVRTSPTLAWEPCRSKARLTHVLAGARPRAAGP